MQSPESQENDISDIGDGRRWYDFAYRITNWVLDDKRQSLPKSARQWLGNAMITLQSYYEMDHIREGDWPYGDPMHVVASGAVHVCVPGIWVVELFPPSKSGELMKALRRKYWVSDDYKRAFGESPDETVSDARRSVIHRWWRLGTVVSKNVDWFVPNSVKGAIPEPFIAITVNMVQVGSSITAVCAFFETSRKWAHRLDREWHTAHDPALYTPIGCPRQLSRRSREHNLAIHNVQERVYAGARKWMSDNFSGVFASWSEAQPALQIMLFDGAAASRLLAGPQTYTYALLEQLGLATLEDMTLEDIPAISLRDCHKGMRETSIEALQAVVGVTDDVRGELGDRLLGYLHEGADAHYAIASYLRNEMQDILLDYGLVRYTECLLRVYGKQRDFADTAFGPYRSKQVDAFRTFVLDNSIDIREARSDIVTFLELRQKFGHSFKTRPIGRPSDDEGYRPIDVVSSYKNDASQNLRRVIELDAVYRDVLSTIVSLGTDNRSLLLARIALWVSVVSLVLAMLTMDTSGDTLFAVFFRWICGCMGTTADL